MRKELQDVSLLSSLVGVIIHIHTLTRYIFIVLSKANTTGSYLKAFSGPSTDYSFDPQLSATITLLATIGLAIETVTNSAISIIPIPMFIINNNKHK
jgi:hypothetical protein